MINYESIKPILERYKVRFPGQWENEKFKWEAVKCFQDNWNIDASNFEEMFRKATDKTYNLLDTGHSYPRAMIMNFAAADNEATRQMFRDLYDESIDLSVRVESFKIVAEEMRTKYDDGTWWNHYQNTRNISTYLWLRYPDKYYIYKYEIMRDVANELNTEYRPKHNGSAESMLGGFALYDDICTVLQNDKEIQALISEAVDDECWPDRQLHTATIDFGFYLSHYYKKDETQDEEGWYPKDYTPGLTVDEWTGLLNDQSVFTLNALQIVKRIKDYGGQATCKQLSIKYGETANFYNAGSVALARRIAGKTDCPISHYNSGHREWWPILYTGKQASHDVDGVYTWKLRKELSEALEQVDLSNIPLYADPNPSIWKISYSEIAEEERTLFKERNIVVVHCPPKSSDSSKVTQGQDFIEKIRKGDFFYLCYGNRIQLLGEFTSDKAVLNPEKKGRWYERSYRVIADSLDTTAYSNTNKTWTPSGDYACTKIEEEDKPLFEELILKPYFDMAIESLYGDEGTRGYWWLTANPKTWSFSLIKTGEEQSYTLYNEIGHKRRIFQNFLNAKEGDLVVGYEANPVKKIVALAKITQASDGESLYFSKTEGLSVPIEYAALKEYPELEKMEFFVQPNGSLFKLTKGEYDFIMDIIREENPLKRPDSRITKYAKEDFLKEVYMTSERYDVLKALLLNKMNVILQGAPGVGKTFTAKRLAYSIMGEKDESRIEVVQFHQNYTYEDFIMGYRPDNADFKLTEGIFYRFCRTAANDPDKEYFFIIDEINRGNMSKIFGELLMLIEKDYRGTDATLAYNGMRFSVPENLYIIGMMNTADRSLAMIDYALRRRFSFFEIEPGFKSEGFQQYQSECANETFNALIEQIKALNKEIKDDKALGKGFMIGHSYFCGREPDQCTVDWMRSVVEFDIIPMLSEYWFDEPEKLHHWENKLNGVFDDE